MNKSDTIVELAKAMASAQGEIENADKNATNPHFRSKYADLAEVLNTVRPVLSKHGLAVIQMPTTEGNIVSVETLLTHSSGEWISSIISCPVGKLDAQGVGSAITYLRRYSLAAVCGCAQEDSDANSVSAPSPAQTYTKSPSSPEVKKRSAEDAAILQDGHKMLIKMASNLDELKQAVNNSCAEFRGDNDVIESFKALAREVKLSRGW